jgi:hypothetical protein
MVKLANMKPTADELAAARAVLEKMDAKGKRSKMECMTYWLKTNPDTEVSESRGDKRKQYLESFLVHQSRQKQAKSSIRNDHVVSTATSFKNEMFWWSKFKMDAEMGSVKATAWRESGKLKVRADPLTGSMEEELKEYAVPVDWESRAWDEVVSANVQTVADADEKDIADFKHTALSFGKFAEPTEQPVKVKTEPQDDDKTEVVTPIEKKFSDIEADPRGFLVKFNDMRMTLAEIDSQATGKKFMNALLEEVAKLQPKLKSLAAVFEAMCMQKAAGDKKAAVSLGKRTMEAEALFKDIEAYAVDIGIIKKKGGKASKK